MIFDLPWTSWLLLLVGVGLGLSISLAFYMAHRKDPGSEPAGRVPTRDPTSGSG